MGNARLTGSVFPIILVLAVLTLAVAGCATTTVSQTPPATDSTTAVDSPTPRIDPAPSDTPAIDPRESDDPWQLVNDAATKRAPDKAEFLLRAVTLFLMQNKVATAQTVLESIPPNTLTPSQRERWEYLGIEATFGAGRNSEALRRLDQFERRGGPTSSSDPGLVHLRSQILNRLNRPEESLGLLVRLDPALVDDAERAKNAHLIWATLDHFSRDQLTLLARNPARPDIAAWAELSLIYAEHGWTPHRLVYELRQWQSRRPSHSASLFVIPTLTGSQSGTLANYQRIAILLPLTSSFSEAASAFYEGFTAAFETDTNPNRPLITLYDFGEKTELVSAYYQRAVRDGADIVIGPLGRQAVEQLVRSTALEVPTLLLANVSQVAEPTAPVFQFGLSPEAETEALADRAFDDGFQNALVLYPDTDWGRRLLQSLSEAWQRGGGRLVEVQAYTPDTTDHSRPINSLFNLDQSNARRDALQRLLGRGTEVEFTPRRRHDVDVLFLIGRPEPARLVKPQVAFFQGHDLPVYATSNIYTGQPDPVNDLDLEGVLFGDMPWVVDDTGPMERRKQVLGQSTTLSDPALNRLVALGMDAYALIFRLDSLTENSHLRLRGATGLLGIGQDRVVDRELTWAEFKQGVPVLVRANSNNPTLNQRAGTSQ